MNEPAPSTEQATGRNTARNTSIVVGVFLVALIALFAFGGGGDDEPTSELLGRRVPAVAGETMAGESYDIDSYRGQFVLVNLFATWCPPCITEHPELVELEAWGAETEQLDIVAVVFNDTADNVAEFFAQRGGSWPVIDDPAVAIDFQIRQVPESFLVDPDGRIIAHYTGGITADDIKSVIE